MVASVRRRRTAVVEVPEVPQPPEGVGGGGRRLAGDVPLAERRRPRHLRPAPAPSAAPDHLGAGGDGDAARRRGVGLLAVAVVVGRRSAGAAVHLHVLPEARGVGVGLVAAGDAAVVRLVGGVDVGVLLPVRGVREATITAFVLALERFLAWKRGRR